MKVFKTQISAPIISENYGICCFENLNSLILTSILDNYNVSLVSFSLFDESSGVFSFFILIQCAGGILHMSCVVFYMDIVIISFKHQFQIFLYFNEPFSFGISHCNIQVWIQEQRSWQFVSVDSIYICIVFSDIKQLIIFWISVMFYGI